MSYSKSLRPLESMTEQPLTSFIRKSTINVGVKCRPQQSRRHVDCECRPHNASSAERWNSIPAPGRLTCPANKLTPNVDTTLLLPQSYLHRVFVTVIKRLQISSQSLIRYLQLWTADHNYMGTDISRAKKTRYSSLILLHYHFVNRAYQRCPVSLKGASELYRNSRLC